MPLGYGMGAAGANVLGAGVKYNVNKNFSIGQEYLEYKNKEFRYLGRRM